MKFLLSSICITIILTSCFEQDPNKEIDEGEINNNVYHSKEIGWTINIPEGWSIITRDEKTKTFEKGAELIESTGVQIDYSGIKHLISFKKNVFNTFQSTSEPYDIEANGDWYENNQFVKEIIYDAFMNQGINIDSSSYKKNIGGLEFEVFHTDMYGPNGEIILHQDMFSKLINGFDFSVVIQYNNEKDKRIMMDTWEESTFE